MKNNNLPSISFVLLIGAVLLVSSCSNNKTGPEYPPNTPFLRFQHVETGTKPLVIDNEISFIANLMIGLLYEEWDHSLTYWYLEVNEREIARDTLTNPQRCVDGCYNKLLRIEGDSLAKLFGTGEMQSSVTVTLETPEDSTITIDTTYSFTLYKEEPE